MVVHVSVPGTPTSLSTPCSPSRGESELPMPSLYQFSAADAASAVDYTNGRGVDDGVVDSPPAKALIRQRIPSPSPLRGNKCSQVSDEALIPSPKGPSPNCHRSNRRLCMDPKPLDAPVVVDVPTVPLVAVDHPITLPLASIAVRPRPTKVCRSSLPFAPTCCVFLLLPLYERPSQNICPSVRLCHLTVWLHRPRLRPSRVSVVHLRLRRPIRAPP